MPSRNYKRRLVREEIKYPRVKVGTATCAGFDGASQFEHVLACGHLVTTSYPNEPCAPNCRKAMELAPTETARMSPATALSLPFYCDACIELANEPQIKAALNSTQAENTRAILRHKEAVKRGKLFRFRQCHIAQKITSVPCDEEGDPVNDYVPSANVHAFDKALPRTGVNMFENIDVLRGQNKNPEQVPLLKTAESSDSNLYPLDAEEEDDINDTVAEGARWVQQQEELMIRRREERSSRILKGAVAASSNKKDKVAKYSSTSLQASKASKNKNETKTSTVGTLSSTSSQKKARAAQRRARKAQRKADAEKAQEAQEKAEVAQRKAENARRKADAATKKARTA